MDYNFHIYKLLQRIAFAHCPYLVDMEWKLFSQNLTTLTQKEKGSWPSAITAVGRTLSNYRLTRKSNLSIYSFSGYSIRLPFFLMIRSLFTLCLVSKKFKLCQIHVSRVVYLIVIYQFSRSLYLIDNKKCQDNKTRCLLAV